MGDGEIDCFQKKGNQHHITDVDAGEGICSFYSAQEKKYGVSLINYFIFVSAREVYFCT